MKKLLSAIVVFIAAMCGAMCLSACSDGKEYSVTCQGAENGYVIVSDKKVEAGEKVILAAHPDSGYRLTEFLLDGKALDGTSFVMPESDVTVSARFEAITYSVEYVLGDATVADDNPVSYTVENAAELIDPQKDGYEVCGWYRYYDEAEAENDYDFDIEYYRVKSLEGQNGNLTLFAHYYNPVHEITVIESEDGWYYVDNSGGACYGDALDVIVYPSVGYELDYIAVNGEPQDGTSFTMPPCDAEITVKFKPIVYTITYELDGGDNDPANPDSYTVEDGEDGYITILDAQKDGYIFLGWYYLEDGYEHSLYDSKLNTYLCSHVTLYAVFDEDPEEYQY